MPSAHDAFVAVLQNIRKQRLPIHNEMQQRTIYQIPDDKLDTDPLDTTEPDKVFAFLSSYLLMPERFRGGAVEVRTHTRTDRMRDRGIFATRDIAKGEFVSLYPAHIVIYYPDGTAVTDTDHVRMNVGALPEVLEMGEDVKSIIEQHEPYRMRVTDHISIIGLPQLDSDPKMLAHFANDAVRGHTAADLEIYKRVSALRNNAMFVCYCKYFVAIQATAAIRTGEEVTVEYGHDYWVTL